MSSTYFWTPVGSDFDSGGKNSTYKKQRNNVKLKISILKFHIEKNIPKELNWKHLSLEISKFGSILWK